MNKLKLNLNPLNNMTEQNIKSLMKKTKTQLIDVISRKDATELELNNKIKNLEEQITEKDYTINDLKCEIEDYKKEDNAKNVKINKLNAELVECNSDIEILTNNNKICSEENIYLKEKINKTCFNNFVFIMLFIIIEFITIYVLND